MRCKPGQRAIVTRTLGVPEMVAYLGMCVRVLRITGSSTFGPMWEIEPGPRHPIGAPGHWMKGDPIEMLADEILTPIPDDSLPEETKLTELEHS